MKKLIIIGAGGDGRNLAEAIDRMGGKWDLLGFLDDDPKKQGLKINGVPVLGKTTDVQKYGNCYFVVLVGSPADYSTKKRLVMKLGLSSERYGTFIYPGAIVSKFSSIGSGSVILPGVVIMANANIGKHVFIASNCNIGHDTEIRDYVTIAPLAGIPGNVKIEEGCYIGMGSTVRNYVTIGKCSMVGMGSVVLSDVPPYHMVVGNPARVLRTIDPTRFES
jgi:sugar O-acyltransferase (sialic acid O-acetyltransferase NeuD family)